MSLLALGSTLARPSHPGIRAVTFSGPLADHSGGTAPGSHRLPRSAVACCIAAIMTEEPGAPNGENSAAGVLTAAYPVLTLARPVRQWSDR